MPEKLSKSARSVLMGRVRSRNTSPEIRVRRLLHALGYRFRLHRADLPGSPDVVLPKYKLCIFVHGCFWHRHSGCKRASNPAMNRKFWAVKFQQNRKRDAKAQRELLSVGWTPYVIWECETRNSEKLARQLERVTRRRKGHSQRRSA